MKKDDILNSLVTKEFCANLDDPEFKKEAEERTQKFIRAKLREFGVARQVVEPEAVEVSQLDRSLDHDLRVKTIDIEPESMAMPITFRGRPTDRYIQAPRMQIPFFGISSETFHITEPELLAYEFPITKVVEDNTVKDIQGIEDTVFINHVRNAINLASTAGYTKAITSGLPTRLTPAAIKALVNMLEGDELPVDCMLMTRARYNDTMQFVGISDESEPGLGLISGEMAEGIIREGFQGKTLFGKRVVTTIKTDLIGNNEIYAFSSKEFFARFYTMSDIKFFLKKERDDIEWSAWEYIGMGIPNIRGCAMIKLS